MSRDIDRRVVRLETYSGRVKRTLADYSDAELLAIVIRGARADLASGEATPDGLRAEYAELPDVLDALGILPAGVAM